MPRHLSTDEVHDILATVGITRVLKPTPKAACETRSCLVPVTQLRMGDVARTLNGQEWQIRERPKVVNAGRTIEATVQRPGEARTRTTMSWPSGDMVQASRPIRLPTA